MDSAAFERLSKLVAEAPNRRRVLGVVGAGLGAAVLGRQSAGAAVLDRQGAVAADVTDEGFGLCHLPGDACSSSTDCCSARCRGGVCDCSRRGRYAIISAICCSGKRRRGRCR